MNGAEAALRRVAGDLSRRELRWALVGGFAVSARAEPRFTRDVDVAVAARDDTVAEQTVRNLGDDGYRLVASVEQDATGRLASVRLVPSRDEETLLDVLFASSGIEAEIVTAAESLQILPGLVVPVATTGHLIALKLLARDDRTRPLDAADLLALRTVATENDLATAREAVEQIVERGYGRDRDLVAALDDLIRP